MFQKKVHPENGMTSEKSRGKLKKVTFAAEVENKGGKRDVGGRGICSQMMIQREEIKKVLVKEKILRMKCQDGKLPQAAMDGNESNGSRECWIKTDEDCESLTQHLNSNLISYELTIFGRFSTSCFHCWNADLVLEL